MFRERIQAKYEDLTPSFRKLADFILQQQLNAAFMTATELARQLDVDAATVVRFAQNLGYSGFREMIKEVQKIVKAELAASHTPSLETPDDVGLLRNLLENERHNLTLAQARLTDQANSVLPTLLGAQRVWVTGQGHCAHLAALCASVLREVGLAAVRIAADPVEVSTSLKGVGAEDLIIGFSLAGTELDVANAVQFARQCGAKTLVFSASAVAPACLAAETTVVCPGSTKTHTPSFTGLAAMIAVLVAAFAARYPERAAALTGDLRQSYRELVVLQAESSSKVNVDELWRQL